MLFLFAAAALSVFVFICAPSARAQTQGYTVTNSDALMQALNDPQCTSITLDAANVYTISQPVKSERTLTVNGGGAVVDFAAGADISVSTNSSLTLSNITLNSTSGHCISLSGSLVFGEKVFFGGDTGVLMRSGSQITSNGAAVSASEKLGALIRINAGGGVVVLNQVRLVQSTGECTLIALEPAAGKVMLRGTVDLLAANGAAIRCDSNDAGPDISVEDGSTVSIAASKIMINQSAAVPGAAVYVPTCTFSTGSGSRLGVTGSYAGIHAKNITVGKDSIVTAQCDTKPASASFSCASLTASEKLSCLSGARLTIGSSGSNYGSGLFAATIEIDSGVSIMYRSINDNSAAVTSSGSVSMGANSSLATNGGGYGIHCKSLITHEKNTLDINDAAVDGISASSTVTLGTSSTVDISAARSAIYSKDALTINSGAEVTLSSAGNGPALWLDGSSASLIASGCTINAVCSSSDKATIKSAVYCGAGITLDSGTRLTAVNNGDIALICAGGALTVTGGSTLNCSGNLGILCSHGSLLLSGKSTLQAEGLIDSAVRVESGSFSISDGSVCDIQGARFGLEVTSGDIYLDGAASFDIRSTADRALYIHNGRLSVVSIERISAWKRHEEKKNSQLWWREASEHKVSWEAPGKDKSNWLVADHTAINPNFTQQFINGTAQSTDFAWYDTEWAPADYSRIGQYCSMPVARSNSFNIPAGKSFSWMLFGQTYDQQLKFKLKSSEGDGTFELLEDGSFTYTAFDYTRGIQSFEFTVENGDGVVSLPATINVLVTASKPPIASSTTFPISSYDAYIDQVGVVDYDGTIAAVKVEQQPTHGTLVINSDGKFSYQPEDDFVGIDSFTYYAIDNMGDQSNVAHISFPVFVTEEMVVCNTSIISESNLGGSVRLSALLGKETVSPAPEFVITSKPVYGTIEFDPIEQDIISYIPYKDFSGTDSFSFAAVNPDGTLTAEGFVTISAVPSQRPTAAPGSFYCTKNASCEGRLSGYDIDGQIGFFNLAEQPQHGTVELDGVTGEFVYHASFGFIGTDHFTYTVTDSDGLVSDPVQVEITVSSLIDNLRQTGRLGAAAVLLCTMLAGIAAITALIIVTVSKRRREEMQEIEKSRLFEFGGSEQDTGFDYYDQYSSYNGYSSYSDNDYDR